MAPSPRDRFPVTHWSLIRAAARTDRSGGREALEMLCRTYWQPVHAYIRYRVRDADRALDLTQGFFAQFLEKKVVAQADEERGRFRSYLLIGVKHFLINEAQRERAIRRGGGQITLSLDDVDHQGRPRPEPAVHETPETIFERHWVDALLTAVRARLEAEQDGGERKARYKVLMGCITGSEKLSHREHATRLGMSEAAVKTSVHRLRRRYGELLREEIARTVQDADQVDEEIRYLLGRTSS